MLENEYTEVEESKLPPLTDSLMLEYGAELGKEFHAFNEPRKILQEQIWPACDRAFMCIRDEMPYIPSMKLIDNGMLGEPGIRNAIKAARDNLMTAMMPTDESWLEPAVMDPEDDDGRMQLIKEFLIRKTVDADLRDTIQISLDQLLSRGVTAVGVRWETLKQVHRLDPKLVNTVKALQEELSLPDVQLPSRGKRIPVWKTVFDGPICYPVDMYRLWLDPTTDIGGKDRTQSYIHLVFKTMNDLKNAKNKKGEKLYDPEILKDVQEWTYAEYYKMNPHECETTKIMGIDPSLESLGKFVPVYIFYRQVRTFEHDESVFVDKFFYVARASTEWRIIRVQENPSHNGCKPFHVFAFDPYLNNPYGTSLAEKALSAWKAQNITEAISLNQRVLNAFPPTFYASGVMKDSRKPKLLPAAQEEITFRPNIGKDWIQTHPAIQPVNVEVGMQTSRYYGQKIQSSTGIQSAGLASDPTASMSKEKTATEVRETTFDAASSAQVVVDRANDKLLHPVVNDVFKLCQQNYEDEQSFLSMNSYGKPEMKKISAEILQKEREITIVGRRGLANKAHATQNATEALKILATPQAGQVIPNLSLILPDILFKILAGLGIPIKPEYRSTPQEIFAKDPTVMIAAIQNALQDPELAAQIAEILINSPEGQQFVNEVLAQGAQQGQQGQPGQPTSKPPEKAPALPPYPGQQPPQQEMMQ